MEREIMPDYAAEAFCQYLIPKNVFEGSEKPKGVKVEGGVRNFFNDEACMIAPSTKVVFLFEKD